MPSKFNIALTYALLVFIWATTPLAIVWSATDLHPLWALALRFFLAFPIAILLLLILRGRLPLDQRSIQSYIAGASSFIGSQIFTYLAVDYLSSGLIALMFGLAPLITGILGVFIFRIRLYWHKIHIIDHRMNFLHPFQVRIDCLRLIEVHRNVH